MTRTTLLARFVGLISASVLSASTPLALAQAPSTRTYYVAAVEVEWDYAPGGINRITGQEPVGLEALILTSGDDRIGRVYKKAVYREFTDSTFATMKERGPDWEHLGYLGPVLRAAVGDTLQVVFNNKASRPYSMHPHGVFYTKDSEGALYKDGTEGADKLDDAVPPGGTHVYTWPVPERAGPAAHDGSSIMWMYHSHVDEPSDVNSGLMGVIIVTRPEMTSAAGRPTDVDREFVIAFAEIDENISWYAEENIQTYAGKPDEVSRTFNFAELPYLLDLRETINGRSYGTLPGLHAKVGERVRWYVFGTSNFEVHAAHWHGQTAVANSMRTDVLNLLTMEMVTADMVPDNPGTWMLHCHVASGTRS
ncbi:MAG TPA: multicopper oxidase domain-containing protein [Rhodothermia bacterium]